MSVPFMPFYIADYLGDTTHLTTTEHGAYMLLLMAMWRSGGSLDNDQKKLARYARLTNQQWARMRENIMPFFMDDPIVPDKITQKRLAAELIKYEVALDKKLERASNGGKAKALKNNKTVLLEAELSNACDLLNSANHNHNQNHNYKIEATERERFTNSEGTEGTITRARGSK